MSTDNIKQMIYNSIKPISVELIICAAIIVVCLIVIESKKHRNKQKSEWRGKRGRGRKSTAYNKSYLDKTGKTASEVNADVGGRGEYMAYQVLSKKYKEENIFPNVYISSQESKTSEIDLILLTPQCLIVLEVKNYGGAIFGSEKQKYWTQRLSGKSYRFYNPIRQNYGHCKAVSALFPSIPPDKVVSLVVFNSRCILRVDSGYVVSLDGLLARIDSILSCLPSYFSGEDFKRTAQILLKHSNQSSAVKLKHVEYVKQVQNQSNRAK